VVAVGRNDYVVEVVVVDEGFGYAVVMAVVVLVARRDLVMRWSFMPLLLLAKGIEGVLHPYEPRSLPIDVLPASFGALDCSLPSQDELLFLPSLSISR
jgi:hypothetical protein